MCQVLQHSLSAPRLAARGHARGTFPSVPRAARCLGRPQRGARAATEPATRAAVARQAGRGWTARRGARCRLAVGAAAHIHDHRAAPGARRRAISGTFGCAAGRHVRVTSAARRRGGLRGPPRSSSRPAMRDRRCSPRGPSSRCRRRAPHVRVVCGGEDRASPGAAGVREREAGGARVVSSGNASCCGRALSLPHRAGCCRDVVDR